MSVIAMLSVVVYSAAVAGSHPNIDTPDPLTKFSGFLRIAAFLLLLVGFGAALASFDGGQIGMAALALVVVSALVVYDYVIVAKKATKGVSKAGEKYLETKKEIEASPDHVTNVHGDAVANKSIDANVDQSTTNIDTLDNSTTQIDQSKTVKDQRTQVEDSVVNRANIGGRDSKGPGQPTQPQGSNQPPRRESQGQPPRRESQGQPPRRESQGQPPRRESQGQPPRRESHDPSQRNPSTQPPRKNTPKQHSRKEGPNRPPENDPSHEPPRRESPTQSGRPDNHSRQRTNVCDSCGAEVDPEWHNCITCGEVL